MQNTKYGVGPVESTCGKTSSCIYSNVHFDLGKGTRKFVSKSLFWVM